MTDGRSLSAHSRRTVRPVVARALLTSDRIGVTPLPPQKPSSDAEVSVRQKVPAARVIVTSSPSTRLSSIQFDTLPPGTRLTVVAISESVSGAVDIEYDRYRSSPSTCTLNVQNWPAL